MLLDVRVPTVLDFRFGNIKGNTICKLIYNMFVCRLKNGRKKFYTRNSVGNDKFDPSVNGIVLFFGRKK